MFLTKEEEKKMIGEMIFGGPYYEPPSKISIESDKNEKKIESQKKSK